MLVQAPPLATKAKASIRWDQRRGVYRDATGHVIPERDIADTLQVLIGDSQERMALLTRQFQTGTLTNLQWRQAIARELRTGHRIAAVVAQGGMEQMTARAWGQVGGLVRGQYNYLTGFFLQTLGEHAGSEKQQEARSRLYGASLWSTYQEVRRREREEAGETLERNILGPVLTDHCGDCYAAAEAGWVPIGTLPRIGARQCKAQCRCHLSFSTGETRGLEYEQQYDPYERKFNPHHDAHGRFASTGGAHVARTVAVSERAITPESAEAYLAAHYQALPLSKLTADSHVGGFLAASGTAYAIRQSNVAVDFHGTHPQVIQGMLDAHGSTESATHSRGWEAAMRDGRLVRLIFNGSPPDTNLDFYRVPTSAQWETVKRLSDHAEHLRTESWHSYLPVLHWDVSGEWGTQSGSGLDDLRRAIGKTYQREMHSEGYETKFNPHHDAHGRFASGSSSGGHAPDLDGSAHTWQDKLDSDNGREKEKATKRRVAAELGGLLEKDPDWNAFVDAMYENHKMNDREITALGTTRSARVAAMMGHQWNVSSADNAPLPLLLQRAVRQEFGLHDAPSPWGAAGEATANESPLAQHVPGLRKYARTVYQHTQNWLKDNGIEGAWLARGQAWEDDAQMGRSGPVRARDVPAPTASPNYRVGQMTAQLQPLNSFTGSVQSAEGYETGRYKMTTVAWVPRERMYATPQTAAGSKHDSEIIVLGGPIQAIGVLSQSATLLNAQGQARSATQVLAEAAAEVR